MNHKMMLKIGEKPGDIQVIGAGPIQSQPEDQFDPDEMGLILRNRIATISWSKKNPTCCWVNIGGMWYWVCW